MERLYAGRERSVRKAPCRIFLYLIIDTYLGLPRSVRQGALNIRKILRGITEFVLLVVAVRAPECAVKCRRGIRDTFRKSVVFSVRRRDGFDVKIDTECGADCDEYPDRDA